MVTSAENELLTSIEGEAPMGRLMRAHYWTPFAISAHLGAGQPPLPVRLFGENYVAFRAEDGRVGLFDGSVPIGAPRCCSEGSRAAGSAASTTGGRSTSRVAWWRRPPRPCAQALRRQRHRRPLPGARIGWPGVGLAGERQPALLPRSPLRRRSSPTPMVDGVTDALELAPRLGGDHRLRSCGGAPPDVAPRHRGHGQARQPCDGPRWAAVL